LKQITYSALENFPLIRPGDDLPGLIEYSLQENNIILEDGDILVLAQKIISKAEGRFVNLSQVHPSQRAFNLEKITGKDPRFIELVLKESKSVIRAKPNTLIVEHRLGFICANAGIDHSNVDGDPPNQADLFLLLPEDPDRSAQIIRHHLEKISGRNLGVVIIDSHGRAWRNGIVGVTIGLSGVPGVVDMRGQKDLFGYELKVTQIAAVDELAASASLLMGQAAESRPVILVHGFPYPLRESRFCELVRPVNEDLFR
jgi:coenzyme F420-0:L-glutamate ligase / coenzyme F420-1:gamma-L-glutamate ligase